MIIRGFIDKNGVSIKAIFQLGDVSKALFRCKKFLDFAIVAFSFVCGKYCPIIN